MVSQLWSPQLQRRAEQSSSLVHVSLLGCNSTPQVVGQPLEVSFLDPHCTRESFSLGEISHQQMVQYFTRFVDCAFGYCRATKQVGSLQLVLLPSGWPILGWYSDLFSGDQNQNMLNFVVSRWKMGHNERGEMEYGAYSLWHRCMQFSQPNTLVSWHRLVHHVPYETTHMWNTLKKVVALVDFMLRRSPNTQPKRYEADALEDVVSFCELLGHIVGGASRQGGLRHSLFVMYEVILLQVTSIVRTTVEELLCERSNDLGKWPLLIATIGCCLARQHVMF